MGAFGDALIGRRLARQTISTFLGTVARRIDQEVDRRMADGVRTPLETSRLGDGPTSEIWIG